MKKNIIISALFLAVAFATVGSVYLASTSSVQAWGGGGAEGGGENGTSGGDGCGGCEEDVVYSQSSYYNQGSYYKQGSYYSQSSYYNQGSYYSQSSYTVPAASCDSFTGSPKTLPYGGGNVTLTWATTNADSVSINKGIGTVAADGSKVVNVTENTTFTLTAKGAGDDAHCTVTIKVQEDQNFSCDLFNIDKSVVNKGESFTITWETTNADSVSINQGIGSVNADGTYVTSTQENKTYTLTATKGNKSVTCSDSVSVRPDTYSQGSYYNQGSYYSQGSYGGGSNSPRCELTISAKKIKKGREVTIEWETSYATDILLKDNHGKTLIDTDDMSNSKKRQYYDGEITVRPTKDTTYTLTASKGSNDRTCKVSVDVESDVTVLEVRDQKPLVSGIYLTQVPYTGFEAGPFLTIVFYVLLTLWALFVAYVLVVKKKVS